MEIKQEKIMLRLCPQCVKKLENAGIFMLKKYIDICKHMMDKEPFIITSGDRGNGDQLTDYLEKNGYVVSTEVSQSKLSFIPFVDADDGCFCSGNCKRAKKKREDYKSSL